MGYRIKQWYQGKSSMVRIYDPKTGIQRDAWFTNSEDAKEACAIMSRIITASPFEGTELVEDS